MTRLVLATSLLAPWSLPVAAQSLPEDMGPRDWASSLPACAMGADAEETGPLLLLYPRPGLPAVVPAGASLYARIRMPSALTPPPGHQQDTALRGFTAELLASDGASVGGAQSRYPLRVVDVRPDSGASLVYRLRLPFPDWVAPGTYSLSVTAPSSGARVSVASVRVIEPGADPRLVAFETRPDLGVDALRQRLASLEGYPVDVLVSDTSPALEVALNATRDMARWPPVLLLSSPRSRGLVRVGGRLLELGACPTGRYARQRRALLEADHVSEAPSLTDAVTHDAALNAWWSEATLGEAALSWHRLGEGLVVTAAPWLPRPAEPRMIVPEDGLATHIEGGSERRWWPGSTLFATAGAPSLATRFSLAPGHEARIERRVGAPRTLRLTAEPARARTDQEVTLRAVSEGDAIIAWRLAEDITAMGPETRHRWALRDRVEVHALAIGEDGVAARGSVEVTVDTRRTGMCALGALPGSPRGPRGSLWACILVVLWTFRRRQHRMRRRSGMNRAPRGIQR